MSIMRPAHDGETEARTGAGIGTGSGTGALGAHRHDPGPGTGFDGARHDIRHDGHRHNGHRDAGTGELVRQAAQQMSELMRAELRLAAAELKDKARHAGTGAGMFGGAALVALYGVAVLLAAAVAAIAVALPVWAAALIIGGFLLLVAGVLAVMGRAQARRATPPKPEQAMGEARQTVAELKERAAQR